MKIKPMTVVHCTEYKEVQEIAPYAQISEIVFTYGYGKSIYIGFDENSKYYGYAITEEPYLKDDHTWNFVEYKDLIKGEN